MNETYWIVAYLLVALIVSRVVVEDYETLGLPKTTRTLQIMVSLVVGVCWPIAVLLLYVSTRGES